jgi:hypothetical protein
MAAMIGVSHLVKPHCPWPSPTFLSQRVTAGRAIGPPGDRRRRLRHARPRFEPTAVPPAPAICRPTTSASQRIRTAIPGPRRALLASRAAAV